MFTTSQKNVWIVKWDKTEKTNACYMTPSNYELKIIDTSRPAPKKIFSIGKKLLMAKSTFELSYVSDVFHLPASLYIIIIDKKW